MVKNNLSKIKLYEIKLLLNLNKNNKIKFKKSYPCKIKNCNYIATTIQYYKMHMMRHNNIFPFKCSFCSYKTVRKYDYNRHQLIHNKKKLYHSKKLL